MSDVIHGHIVFYTVCGLRLEPHAFWKDRTPKSVSWADEDEITCPDCRSQLPAHYAGPTPPARKFVVKRKGEDWLGPLPLDGDEDG